MMTAQNSTVGPARPRRWIRKLAIVAGVVLVLLIVAYFVATSSAFVRGVILPRVGKAMNAQVTASDVSISPFSSVVLRQLNVQTGGSGPLLQVEEVRLRYQLWSILRGDIRVDEVLLSSPVVNLTLNPDGSSNADALLKSGPPSKKPAPESGQPPRIDLRNFALKNGAVRITRNLAGGVRETAELSNINITLDHLANAASGALNLDASFKLDCQTNGALQAKAAGQFTFALDAGLRPQSAKGSARLDVGSATGPLADLAQLAGILDCELTPTELKQLALHFENGGRQLGIARIEGPLDATKGEGNLKFEISSIDRSVLNLAGAPMGIDFGGTTINSTGRIGLSKNGSQIAANGQVNISRFSIARTGQTTPTIDLTLACQVSVDNAGQTARVETFTLAGSQVQQPFLRGSLTEPMTLAWGKTAGATGDSAFELGVTNFNLGDWRAFLGNSISSGRLQLVLRLGSQQGGRQLKLDTDAQIDGLAMKMGGQPFTQGQLAVKLRAQIDNFEKINLAEYKLDLTQRQQPALSLAGSANYGDKTFTIHCRTELVPLNLTGSGPASTISADLQADGTFHDQLLDLKKLLVSFPPTKLAGKNEIQAAGKLDTGNPKLTKGNLTITADTLDVTPFYDTFVGAPKPAAAPSSTTAAPPAPTPNVEPEAMDLPFDLTLAATMGKLFLREIVVSDFTTTIKVAGNHVLLDPFKGNLNGASLNAKADINVGVKGYAYDLNLSADKLPLEPIANSFSPEYRGQYQGTILANARIQGAGITGASLRKSLGGQLGFSFTNANIQIVGRKTRAVLVPIGAILRIDDITKLPLNWVGGQMDFGGGNITVRQFAAQSGAFEAKAQGAIPIADVLAQSALNLPVDFSLGRSLAQKADLVPAGTPTNNAYVPLPKFVTMTGTVGDPKVKTDRNMIAALLVKSGIGIAENLGVKVDGKSGDALKGLGNLLTGQGSSNTDTNAAGDTNKPARINPLDLFKKPKK